MKRLLSRMKMKQRMMILAISGIVLTAIVLEGIFYIAMHEVYRDKIMRISQETITQSAKYLNKELIHVLQLSHGGLLGYDVAEMTSRSKTHQNDPIYYGQIQEMLTQFKIQNKLIYSAHLVYRGHQVSDLNCKGKYDLNQVLQYQPEVAMVYWHDEAITLPGSEKKVVPVVIPVPNPQDPAGTELENRCVLVIDLSLDEIMKTLENMERRMQGQLCLLNESGESFSDDEPEITDLDCVQTARLEINGWSIEAIQNEKDLLSEFYEAQVEISAVFLVIVLVFVWVASMLARSVTKPLQELTESTQRLSIPDHLQEIEVKGSDEIAQLGNALNSLQHRLQEYKEVVEQDKQIILEEEEKKRKIEMSLLQSQINPHFLYNTLDTMYWYCVDNNTDQVGKLILELSDFFRLTLSKGQEIVTVRHEIQHVETYLKIQKTIFGDKFDYSVQMDPKAAELRIMKILLQPLVENSILHGFADLESGGEIEVNVYRKNGWLVMQVLDNGCGFPQQGAFESGFALSNIRQRLHSSYGDKAVITTERILMGMTKVEIKIAEEVLSQ